MCVEHALSLALAGHSRSRSLVEANGSSSSYGTLPVKIDFGASCLPTCKMRPQQSLCDSAAVGKDSFNRGPLRICNEQDSKRSPWRPSNCVSMFALLIGPACKRSSTHVESLPGPCGAPPGSSFFLCPRVKYHQSTTVSRGTMSPRGALGLQPGRAVAKERLAGLDVRSGIGVLPEKGF